MPRELSLESEPIFLMAGPLQHYPLVLIICGRKRALSWAARPGAISMYLR